eukprot:Tbor_TRINITY_DN6110_c2_g1::TRINITY_DN6110_c2_g1_i15::g.21903::m.21903
MGCSNSKEGDTKNVKTLTPPNEDNSGANVPLEIKDIEIIADDEKIDNDKSSTNVITDQDTIADKAECKENVTGQNRDDKERHDNQKSSDIIRDTNIEFNQYYDSSIYKMGGPKMEGEVKALFKTGLLYRITGNNKYSYYNDTPNYEMHITSDDYKLVLYPSETCDPINGDYTLQSWNFTAKPLSHEYRKKIFGVADKKVQDELAAIRKHTYSDDPEEVLRECLKNNIMYVDNNFKPCHDSTSRQHDKRTLPLQP